MPPPSLSEIAYSHLQNAINLGLAEREFWEMTIAEVMRYEEGAMWRIKQKAQFDHILANLIGISCARMMSKDVKYPAFNEVYNFNDNQEHQEENEQTAQDIATQNSINRFLEFATRHNAKMKEGEGNK